MSVKNLIEEVKQRMSYLNMVVKDRHDLFSCDQEMHALKHDAGSSEMNAETHYKFGGRNMAQAQFNDFVAAKIGASLRESKTATAITLVHGDVTDKGMSAFLKGVAETKAPVKALHIEDMPNVSEKSLQVLPAIIEKKGITLCDVGGCRVSSDLKKQINLACGKNQNLQNIRGNEAVR